MPRAPTPRGMIVTLWTGSAWGSEKATRAWPISWWATMSRSASDRTRLLRSSPATTRSIASSRSAVSTASFPLRAASRAASLTMLARSAPAKPGVRAAITWRSTVGASRITRAWIRRIASRPRTSGLSTTTWRSKRPARRSAGSRTSGRVVAAMMMTPWDAPAQSLVLRGVAEEVHHFHQLRLGLVHPRHVVEGDLELLAVVDLHLRAAEGEGLGRAPPHAPHGEHPDRRHDPDGEEPAEHEVAHERGLDPPGELDVVGLELLHQARFVDAGDAHEDEERVRSGTQ